MPSTDLDTLFAALADPTRRAILARLASGEAPVKELAEPFNMSLPAISKHLKVLERSGLITRGRAAQFRPCRLVPTPLKEASLWLETYRRLWDDRFDRLNDYLHQLQANQQQTPPMSDQGNQTSTEPPADHVLLIERIFNAPRSLVYEAWTKQEHADQWFKPKDCTLLENGADVRSGGTWRMSMRVPDGEVYSAGGRYRAVVPNEKLEFTHAWEGDDGKPEHETVVTVTFADHGPGQTLMSFRQAVMKSVESRDNHRKGWGECFDNLAAYLTTLEAA